MALPTSMRYLAAATVCILVYLFLQLVYAPQPEMQVPTSKLPGLKHGNADREPQLDRTSPLS
jgi:mannosyltransferase